MVKMDVYILHQHGLIFAVIRLVWKTYQHVSFGFTKPMATYVSYVPAGNQTPCIHVMNILPKLKISCKHALLVTITK